MHDIGAEAMRDYFVLIEARLSDCDWWYGDVWSAIDAYLRWMFWRVEGAGFATAQLDAKKLRFTPPPLLA